MSDYPETLELEWYDAGYWMTIPGAGTHYTRTDDLPRWRPASDPVPQDEPTRLVVLVALGRVKLRTAASAARYQRHRYRQGGEGARWCWWDELDALLSRGVE